MIDFVGKKKWFLIASLIPMIIGIVFIVVNGIPWGIDFTGGTVFNVETVTQDTLKTRLDDLGYPDADINSSGEDGYTIQTRKLAEADSERIRKSFESFGLAVAKVESTDAATVMTVNFGKKEAISRSGLASKLSDLGHAEATIQETGEGKFIVETKEIKGERSQIEKAFGDVGWTISSLDSVSDPIAKEKARNAIIGVAIAAAAMLLYIWWAFRKVPKPFRYGSCAIIALLHDVFICISFYVIFADALNLEINLMFITGILTVIGYSVNDTVVVFDRIRENIGKGGRDVPFGDVVNRSLTETLARCLITVLTTLLAAAAVLLFVGEPIRNFLAVLLVGIASGAYSSVFVASMLLVVWETRTTRLSEATARSARFG